VDRVTIAFGCRSIDTAGTDTRHVAYLPQLGHFPQLAQLAALWSYSGVHAQTESEAESAGLCLFY